MTPGDSPWSLAVANGVVYLGSYGGRLDALDARDGTLLWTYQTKFGLGFYSYIVVANGVVYTGAGDGTVYAFDLSGSDSQAAPQPPDAHSLVPDLRLKVRMK